MNASILEAARTKYWDLGAEDLHALRDALLSVIGQTSKEEMQKQRGYLCSASNGFSDHLYVDDATWVGGLRPDDKLINVVNVCGPITRSGGACSYGSIDHYHQVEYANSLPQTVGHIFLLNTPGGAASARKDYAQAIQESRAQGKPCIAFIDGTCCSAGMFIASQCDLVISRNPKNDVGCIGTMVAFFTLKDGDTHTLSQERYVEITAEESPDKNLEYRQAAEGDYTLLKKELSRLSVEFQEAVKAGRPSVGAEVLTGKVYAADEVLGQLVDEISNWQHAINCVLALSDDMSKSRYGQSASATDGETEEPHNDEPSPEEDPEDPNRPEEDPEEPGEQPGTGDTTQLTSEPDTNAECEEQNATTEQPAEQAAEEPAADTMGDAAGGEGTGEDTESPEPATTEETTDSAATEEPTGEDLTAQIQAAADKAIADVKAQFEAAANDMEAKHKGALEALEAKHAEEVADFTTAVQELTEQVNNLTHANEELAGQLTDSEARLETAEKELKAAQDTIKARDLEIQQLSETGTEAPVAAVPEANGQGVVAKNPREANNVIKPGMTGKEARAAQKARMEELRRKACGF